LGRVVRIQLSGVNVADKRADIGYDAAGHFTSISRFGDLNGSTLVASTAYGFDAAGRLTSLTHDANGRQVVSYQLTLDADGRVTLLNSADGTTAYGYDALSQVISADFSYQPDHSYSYDVNGNQTGSGIVNDANNRVLSDGTYNYAYDAEGNRIRRTDITSGEVTDYQWDHHNRLTAVTVKNTSGDIIKSASYRYDAFDRRIAMTSDVDGNGATVAQTELYVLDRNQIGLVLDDAGQVIQSYLFGPQIDMVLAEERGGQTYWMLPDQTLSVHDVIDASGVLRDHLTYDVFGQITGRSDTALQPRFTFTGREFDAISGLFYYRARYYDAGLGRFVSEDAMGFAAGDTNLYGYVGNDPVDSLDPTGNCGVPKSLVVGIGAAAGAAWGIFEMTPLGIAAEAGWAIGGAINNKIDYWTASPERRKNLDDQAAALDAQKVREMNDPCSDLLHTISNIPLLPGKAVDAAKAGFEQWASGIEKLYNSNSCQDVLLAGFKVGEVAGAIYEAGLKPAFEIAKSATRGASSVLEGAASAGRAARAEVAAARAEEVVAAMKYERELAAEIRAGLEEFIPSLTNLEKYSKAGAKASESWSSVVKGWVNDGMKALKKASLAKWGAVTSATATQQAIILQHAAEEGLEIGIRASDRITATVTKIESRVGFAAKPMKTKAKSYFGFLIDDGRLMRSDLDLAWVKDVKTGRYLTEQEVFDRVVDPLNKKIIMAGEYGPSFMHGAHFTMSEARGGFVREFKMGPIDGPGAVTVFKPNDLMVTLSERRVYEMAQANPAELPWHSGWATPKGPNDATIEFFKAPNAVAVKEPLSSAEKQLKLALKLVPKVIKNNPPDGTPLVGVVAMSAFDVPAANFLQLDTREPLQLEGVATDLWMSSLAFSDNLHIRIAIADLPFGELAESFITRLDANGVPSEGKIVLDWSGDGQGWFFDSTPLDSVEFSQFGSDAQGHYDLLSALLHETGHILGLMQGNAGYDQHLVQQSDGSWQFVDGSLKADLTSDGSHLDAASYPADLMSDSLALSQRELPSAIDAQIITAARRVSTPVISISSTVDAPTSPVPAVPT
ncbi:MAG: RHS repeat-associated core domain-containing protein, partial [Pseudomonadota bacterium]